MIKITANSMWRKQAELLMLQIEKHMSKHKWNSLLKITPVRVAEHSTGGWKAVNKELWLLSSLLSSTSHDLLQYLSCTATATVAGTVKNYFGPVLQMR